MRWRRVSDCHALRAYGPCIRHTFSVSYDCSFWQTQPIYLKQCLQPTANRSHLTRHSSHHYTRLHGCSTHGHAALQCAVRAVRIMELMRRILSLAGNAICIIARHTRVPGPRINLCVVICRLRDGSCSVQCPSNTVCASRSWRVRLIIPQSKIYHCTRIEALNPKYRPMHHVHGLLRPWRRVRHRCHRRRHRRHHHRRHFRPHRRPHRRPRPPRHHHPCHCSCH